MARNPPPPPPPLPAHTYTPPPPPSGTNSSLSARTQAGSRVAEPEIALGGRARVSNFASEIAMPAAAAGPPRATERAARVGLALAGSASGGRYASLETPESSI
jgi:hypothetical protein